MKDFLGYGIKGLFNFDDNVFGIVIVLVDNKKVRYEVVDDRDCTCCCSIVIICFILFIVLSFSSLSFYMSLKDFP